MSAGNVIEPFMPHLEGVHARHELTADIMHQYPDQYLGVSEFQRMQ